MGQEFADRDVRRGAPAESGAVVLERQQAALLGVLREAQGAVASFAELQQADVPCAPYPPYPYPRSWRRNCRHAGTSCLRKGIRGRRAAAHPGPRGERRAPAELLAARQRTCLTYAYALYDLGRALALDGPPAAAVSVLERRLQIENQRPTVAAELEQARAQAG